MRRFNWIVILLAVGTVMCVGIRALLAIGAVDWISWVFSHFHRFSAETSGSEALPPCPQHPTHADHPLPALSIATGTPKPLLVGTRL